MQACALTVTANLFLLVSQSISKSNSSQEEMFNTFTDPSSQQRKSLPCSSSKGPWQHSTDMPGGYQQYTWQGQARKARVDLDLGTPVLCMQSCFHVPAASITYEKVPVLVPMPSEAQIVL